MNKGVRMMLLSQRKNPDRIDWENDKTRRYDRDMRYDDGYPQNRRGGMRGNDYGRIENRYDDGRMVPNNREWEYDIHGTTAPRSEYWPEIYGAFTDRNGRRHYDNGRYAPQNRYDDGYNEPYRDTTMGFTMPQYHHKGYEFEADGVAGDMRGYMRGNIMPMDSSMRKNGKKSRMMHDEVEPLSEEEAKEWAKSMKNADGTNGPHWTMEQTTKAMRDRKLDYDEIDFFLALNATYSDLSPQFKRYNIDKLDAYIDFAVAEWLCDEDAVEDKLSAYYDYVVEH